MSTMDSAPTRGISEPYVACDIPGRSGSVLLNLNLVDALRRSFKQLPRGASEGISGILLGRSSADSTRTLITLEDCHPIRDEQERIPEHLGYWRSQESGQLSPAGFVQVASNTGELDTRAFESHFAGSPAVLMVLSDARGGIPNARLYWSEDHDLDPQAYADIPLDSARIKAAGLTILHGLPASQSPRETRVPRRRSLLKWAWIPAAAALLIIAAAALWNGYGPSNATTASVSAPASSVPATDSPSVNAGQVDQGSVDRSNPPQQEDFAPRDIEPTKVVPAPPVRRPEPQPSASAPAPDRATVNPAPARSESPQPAALPQPATSPQPVIASSPPPPATPQEKAAAPEPAQPDNTPPPIQRRERPRRVNPPATVTVEYRPAPENTVRRVVNRVPGLRLLPLPRFLYKDGDDFVPASPSSQPRPAVPADVARAFPGAWRVDLRVAVDKSGEVTHASLLTPNANREFVKLALNAIDQWQFEPARVRNRPVSSALDITFMFRNPVSWPNERAAR